MKTTIRLESAIEAYRDRIIIPRQVVEFQEHRILVTYTATVINEENLKDIFPENIQIQRLTLEETIKVIKREIDLAISKYADFVEKEKTLYKDIFQILKQQMDD